MRRGTWFWGGILIVIGLLFLLGNLGLLPTDAGNLIWPAVLILIGLWILYGAFYGRRGANVEHVTIPLEGAPQARLRVRHGAGRLDIHAGAGAGELLSGTFAGGLDYRARREGDVLDVKLRVPEGGFPGPWNWHGGVEWVFGLSKEVPLALDLRLGANEARLDLAELRVTDLHLETGASSTNIMMPAAAGYTRADIHSGVGAVNVTVPAGVAARIRTRGGLAGIKVDTSRFPQAGSDTYQSADYAGAANRLDLDTETGLGALEIR